ncbi:uncharacterized protein L201_006254 [Kwoniella dendrophila CBS 6074]|uniref:Mediator of RNA polymerase II transcription subunit 5 n=1 Tax=Kwoniella dendrophila CBS 6074 TaxID=1295534 RepID=A0AAX4K164_9TREE
MTYEDLTVSELIGKAYARALPPKKLIKIIQTRINSLNSNEDIQDVIAGAILPYLLPSPPSLILSYLSQLLNSNLITSRTIFIRILFYIHDHGLPSITSIISIFNILSTNLTGLDEPIPSLLSAPSKMNITSQIPDVGTSASGSGSASNSASNVDQRQISTSFLILPLLRLCSSNSQSTSTSIPMIGSLITYLSKIVSILSTYPSPSLDVGLEVGQLLSSLPEEISLHLRNNLSGLMTDLDNQDSLNSLQQTQTQIQSQQIDQDVNGNGNNIQMQTSSNRPNITQIGYNKLPLKQGLTLFIEWAKRSTKLLRGEDSQHKHGQGNSLKGIWITVLKVGKEFTYDSDELLKVLLEISIQNLIQSNVDSSDAAENWGILIEQICELVSWWKTHSEEVSPFPNDIVTPLSSVFQLLLPSMQTFSEQLTQKYNTLTQHAENEDEGSTFTPLEGWNLLPLQETLISKFVQLGILTREEASTVGPGINIHAFTPGESLINRLSFESHSHLPPLVHTIQYSFGASLTFSNDLIQIIRSCPASQPPENLFNYISSLPGLLNILQLHINPLDILDIMISQLLNLGVDEQSRNDDPQNSLTRFGEGVALVESFVNHYHLPLPPLLEDARRTENYNNLPEKQKECMNGWVKAIFGSDGIEDAILLATSPQDLYTISATLIEQAILAVIANQIDLDTLHSGLSYFSQPLLSWCLGGVVFWLCKEITRQGLLSAIHLIVLQDLILGHSCPESLIRVNLKPLKNLLNSNDLKPVFESSNFDIEGVKAKLDSITGFNVQSIENSGLTTTIHSLSQPVPAIPNGNNISLFTSNPNANLTDTIRMIRDTPSIESLPTGWERSLLDSLSRELSLRGGSKTLELIMSEISNIASLSSIPSTPSNLVGFIPILLTFNNLRQSDRCQNCLLETLIDTNWLTSYISNSPSTTPPPSSFLISQIIKESLLLHSSIYPTHSTEYLVLNLLDEFESLLSKSVLLEDYNSDITMNGKKKRKFNQYSKKLYTSQRDFVENIIKYLRDDEGLRSKSGLSGLNKLDDLL